MPGLLSIGEFSRASHMTVKTLRHYHQIGLLEPAAIDSETGYRQYATDQIPIAQVIRRFRDLGMSLEDIRGVLSAPDLQARNERITHHLSRLEAELGRTQAAVASLRNLLAAPSPGDPSARVELRRAPAVDAVAISDVVSAEEAVPWLQGALAELRATLVAHGERAAGPAGGIYPDNVFTEHRGQVTIFVPVAKPVQPSGRVIATQIPAAELAVIEHRGPPDGVDRAYGTLATYVAHHAIAVEGPIREYYVVGQHDTPRPAEWRTEIGWPIFRTGSSQHAGPRA
jgi:DNA-binding transcriptional MerR regulator